jgi:hypothetical protein
MHLLARPKPPSPIDATITLSGMATFAPNAAGEPNTIAANPSGSASLPINVCATRQRQVLGKLARFGCGIDEPDAATDVEQRSLRGTSSSGLLANPDFEIIIGRDTGGQVSCHEEKTVFGQADRRRAVIEYMTHYHAERNHQGPSSLFAFKAALKFAAFPRTALVRLS